MAEVGRLKFKEYLHNRKKAMWMERDKGWTSHWKDLSKYVLPTRGRFLTNDQNQGFKRNTNIIDNTGMLAARNLAAGMMGGLTNPARPWFKLKTADPMLNDYHAVREWLDSVAKIMLEIFSRSNTYNGLHILYGETGTFGQMPLYMQSDFEDVVRTYPFTVGSYALAHDDRLKVNTVFREVPLTVGQMVKRFGYNQVSQPVRRMWDKSNYDEWVTCYHAIEPNEGRDYRKRDSVNMQFRSVYWEEKDDGDSVLGYRGYMEFPAFVPRWSVTGTNIYGYSPGMDALPDIRQLQNQQRYKGMGIQKSVNPPMTAPQSMQGQDLSTLPGSVTFIDTPQGQPIFTPAYQVEPRLQEMMMDIQEVQLRIKRAYYEDLFLMLASSDRRQITAREVEERHEEKLIMLGPVLTRLQDELLDPLIDRTFNIALTAGILPPPPEELQGMPLRVEYTSILAQAQKAIGIGNVERLLANYVGLAQVQPQAVAKIDADEVLEQLSDMLGTPPSIIRPQEEVDAMRAEEAQRQQAAESLAMAESGAKAAQELSNADMSGDNLATRLMERVGGGG